MSKSEKRTVEFDLSDLPDPAGVIEIGQTRARAGAMGAAQPLLAARSQAARREHARAVRKYGADSAQAAQSKKAYEALEVRELQFGEELGRSLIDPPPAPDEGCGLIWGRITKDGVAVEDTVVIATRNGKRLKHVCTDKLGGYRIELGEDIPFRLEVRDHGGAVQHRDPEDSVLSSGQTLRRDIDLDRDAETPCPPPPGESDQGGALVEAPRLLRMPLDRATGLLSERGLEARHEGDIPSPTALVGLVVDQSPDEGALLSPGATVSLWIGARQTGGEAVAAPIDDPPEGLPGEPGDPGPKRRKS